MVEQRARVRGDATAREERRDADAPYPGRRRAARHRACALAPLSPAARSTVAALKYRGGGSAESFSGPAEPLSGPGPLQALSWTQRTPHTHAHPF